MSSQNLTDSSHFIDGLSSIINFSGFAVPARARFVAQCVGSALYSSLTVGLVCGQVGALTSFGPLIPFMTGSWLGYTYGCFGFWRQSRAKTLNCAETYPKLLAHALQTNFNIKIPQHVNLEEERTASSENTTKSSCSLEEWILQGGVQRLSFAMLATQSCDEDILELQKSERQRVMEKYTETNNN